MSEVPVNEKLYAMVVFQAKAKYRIYPSPGASHWVHRRYLELGGRFENSEEKNRRDKLTEMAIAKRRAVSHGGKEAEARKEKNKKKDSGDK